MEPYQNESETSTIGELTIENRLDRVSLYGSLDLTRDQAGLAAARRLHSILGEVILHLESSEGLPGKIKVVEPVEIENPLVRK